MRSQSGVGGNEQVGFRKPHFRNEPERCFFATKPSILSPLMTSLGPSSFDSTVDAYITMFSDKGTTEGKGTKEVWTLVPSIVNNGTAEDLVGRVLRFVAEALLLSGLILARSRDWGDGSTFTLLDCLEDIVPTVVRLGLHMLLPRALCVAVRLPSASPDQDSLTTL